MAIERIIYSNSTAIAGGVTLGPVISSSIDYNVPLKSVFGFGKFRPIIMKNAQGGKIALAQTDYTTFKSEFKMLVQKTSAGMGSTLTNLLESAAKGDLTKVSVSNGFTAYAILTNVSIDASVGEFITCSLSWAGVGTPEMTLSAADVDTQHIKDGAPAPSFSLATSNEVNHQNSNVKSAKFSFDIPTEVIKVIGNDPTVDNSASINTTAKIVAKPPYKATLSFDGPLVDAADANGISLSFGGISVNITDAKRSSQKFDQKAGDVAATTSVSYEGSKVTFT